jgi:GGDEF domain-containing protein
VKGTKELEDLIDRLKHSPIFNMSLASKELFHSNFIAWMIERYPEHFLKLFEAKLPPEFKDKGYESVDRERKNIDLTINLKDDYRILIENKVKSMPYEEQLNKYQNKEGNEKTTLFLLSLYESDYFKENWNYITYSDIIKTIERILKSELKDNDKVYLSGYASFVQILIELMQYITENNERFNFSSKSKDYERIAEIRMHDVFHKVKYELLLREVLSELDESIVNSKDQFKATTYYSRSTGACNFYLYIDKDGEKVNSNFEIQLQDNALKFMVFKKGIVNNNAVIQNSPFIEFYKLFKEIAKENTTYPKNDSYENPKFNKYGDYIIYKYFRIDEMKMEELVEILTNAITKAHQLIIDHKT